MRLRAFLSEGKPHRVYRLRYEREDGQYREITVPVGWARFERGTEAKALEIAERRLSEQFGDALFAAEADLREKWQDPNYIDPAADVVRKSPGLHQENYQLVSIERVK